MSLKLVLYYTDDSRSFQRCTTKMSSATSTTPPTTPSTTVSTEMYLIKITLHNTSDPMVSRLLSVPGEAQFSELHEAIAAAFGWDCEPCTSWSFQNTKKSPLVASPVPGDVAIYYTFPDQGYDITPSRLHDQDRLDEWMGLETHYRFWLYDYNISRHHHAIEVMEIGTVDGLSKIRWMGGQGSINRKAWQFGNFNGKKGVTGGRSSWEFDMTSTHKNMELVQAKYEKRTADEAVVHMDETPVRKDDDDDDDDVVVRRDRGTKRRLSDSS